MLSAWVPALIALLLDILLIVYLVRGPLKRFIFVFCYCLIEAVDIVGLGYLQLRPSGLPYESFFWAADWVSHALITLILLSLIRESLGSSADLRRLASWVLPVAIAGVAIGSVLAFRDPSIKISVWMTPVTRNLSFAEEILNFMLWTALIRNRDYDRLLLFISAGIGVQVTGEVIGHTIRTFMRMRTMIWLPDTLLMVS